MSFGVMGGHMQPQGHARVMVRLVDYGQNPQAATDGPRYRVVEGLGVDVESSVASETSAELGAPRSPIEELARAT